MLVERGITRLDSLYLMAGTGDAEAQYELGTNIIKQAGSKINLREAVNWLKWPPDQAMPGPLPGCKNFRW